MSALVCAPPLLGAAPVSYAAGAFVLFAPVRLAALSARAADPAARKTIAAADKALEREPDPLPRVHTEHTLPSDPERIRSLAAERDFVALRDLGLAFRITGEERYATAAQRYLHAWLAVYHPDFNPIDETRFDDFIAGYDLVRDRLGEADRVAMRALLRDFATGYLDPSKGPNKGDVRVNNWNSHRVKLIALSAFGLGDPQLVRRAQDAFVRQLDVNVRADGSVLDFPERDALHYVVYDLEPLAYAALAAKEHGLDWYALRNSARVGLPEALAWLRPYADGVKTHEEYAHSRVAFDAERRAAGERGFSGPFDPAQARELYALATALDPTWRATSERLGAPDPWLALGFSHALPVTTVPFTSGPERIV